MVERFFYQSPRNLDAYFQGSGDASDPRNNGSDTNQFNIFAFPNKLNLDDRIGMLSVSFPTRRYIAYGTDPNADVYDLRNPLKADTLLYHVAPNSYQDIRLSYVQPAIGRLVRAIDSFDELTVATSWKSPDGNQSMQVIAAVGSPYVTVLYYVDHMFHYGYYIYAASVVAALDPEHDTDLAWLAANKEKVNLLVRDIANPSLDDPYFPIVRTFDWFRMQNIADTGPDANGGNTESSSESVNSNYALATWGAVTKNDQFQALAAIMTAAEIRTSKAFYQITPDTAYVKAMDFPEVDVTVKLPKDRIEVGKIAPGNEPVMNILRSNIVETNTFFGPLLTNRIGINLLPISPISEYVISKDWAKVITIPCAAWKTPARNSSKASSKRHPTRVRIVFWLAGIPMQNICSRMGRRSCLMSVLFALAGSGYCTAGGNCRWRQAG